MKLLTKKQYNYIEELLRTVGIAAKLEEPFNIALTEIKEFFNVDLYKNFLQLFYFDRYKYKNRYPDNRSMIGYLCEKLFASEPQLYIVRKEIVYKSAMILYKYNILEE